MSTGAPAQYVMQRGSPFRAPGARNDTVISCIRKKLLRKGTEKQTRPEKLLLILKYYSAAADEEVKHSAILLRFQRRNR